MAEKKKINYGHELTKGILKENPVLRLVLGTCTTLATSTSVVNGVGMGIAATIVLICSNIVISALRKVIPAKARIPAYIVVISSWAARKPSPAKIPCSPAPWTASAWASGLPARCSAWAPCARSWARAPF